MMRKEIDGDIKNGNDTFNGADFEYTLGHPDGKTKKRTLKELIKNVFSEIGVLFLALLMLIPEDGEPKTWRGEILQIIFISLISTVASLITIKIMR